MSEESKNILFVLNDGPYGNERPYNALRMALNVVKRPGTKVRVFLVGDGVMCARRGQIASTWLEPDMTDPSQALRDSQR